MRDSRRRYPAHRKGEAGSLGRKVLLKLLPLVTIVVLTGGVGFFCYEALGQSGFFQIADIEIEGCQRISKKEILELSGIDVHSNLFKLSSVQMENLLEGHPWVARSEIAKNWPNRLTISVEERMPVAIINLADGLYYVDQSANVFAPVGKAADLDYPVITGLAGEKWPLTIEGSVLEEALLLIKYASRDNPNLPVQNISEISIRENDLVLLLMDRPFEIHFGRDDIGEKYNRLVKVLYWLYKRKEFARVSYVYVDYSLDKVLVGMEAG